MNLIRLSKSTITSKDKIKLNVLDKEFLGMGEEVNNLENLLSNYFNSNVACVSSGTNALQLALQAINIKRDDEVLVPALTYVAAFQAITGVVKPISLDVNYEDLNFDLNDIKKITEKTKCIMPVHYCGSHGNLKKLFLLKKLRVIEDAAHVRQNIIN